MKLKILHWNIWMDNQIVDDRSNELIKELKTITYKHKPDLIGLNEVLQKSTSNNIEVLDFLEQNGYRYTHFAKASPLNKEFNIGCAIASKHKINIANEFVICNDTPAKRRGYDGHSIKAIEANVSIKTKDIKFIVAHPIVFTHFTYKDHFQSIKNLTKKVKSLPPNTNLIIAGDFNESIHWPTSFHYKNMNLDVRTGSIKTPTWKFQRGVINYDNGSLLKTEDNKFYSAILGPARLNLDHIYWNKSSKFKLVDFKVIDIDTSDHRPLIAEFEV